MLNGRLPWLLQRLFKLKLPNVDGAFVEYWLALALTTIPENSGNLDPVSKFVQLRIPAAAVALQVFSVGIIVGCTHVVFATVPVSDPAGFIGLRGNGLTPSKIDDFLSAPSL